LKIGIIISSIIISNPGWLLINHSWKKWQEFFSLFPVVLTLTWAGLSNSEERFNLKAVLIKMRLKLEGGRDGYTITY
jgi:hypothetical protein